jgi:hypothetical protein
MLTRFCPPPLLLVLRVASSAEFVSCRTCGAIGVKFVICCTSIRRRIHIVGHAWAPEASNSSSFALLGCLRHHLSFVALNKLTLHRGKWEEPYPATSFQSLPLHLHVQGQGKEQRDALFNRSGQPQIWRSHRRHPRSFPAGPYHRRCSALIQYNRVMPRQCTG